ncbi:MAG: hypothetical protein K6G56_08445 [Clostridiales bacterium]|nr:hypothetical protein [Clostridiales bacterium]
MKKTAVLAFAIILIICLALAGCQKKTPEGPEEGHGVKDTAAATEAPEEEETAAPAPTKAPRERCVMTQEEEYANGELLRRTSYRYNSHGDKTYELRETFGTYPSSEERWYGYEYDDHGSMIYYKCLDEDGYTVFSYEYDGDRITKKTENEYLGTMQVETEWTYDENGRASSMTERRYLVYGGEKTLNSEVFIEYARDEKGRVLTETRNNPDKGITSVFTFTYDEHGYETSRRISGIQQNALYYDYDVENEYDSAGRRIKAVKRYSFDGVEYHSSEVWEYEGDTLVRKLEQYDTLPDQWTAFEYDENGYPVKKIANIDDPEASYLLRTYVPLSEYAAKNGE